MFKTKGRLIGKTTIKSGVSEKGTWRIIEFIVNKVFNKKKMPVAFVASGKCADIINTMPLKQKMQILFYPNCRFYKGKYYTELKVFEIVLVDAPVNSYSQLDAINNRGYFSPAEVSGDLFKK